MWKKTEQNLTKKLSSYNKGPAKFQLRSAVPLTLFWGQRTHRPVKAVLLNAAGKPDHKLMAPSQLKVKVLGTGLMTAKTNAITKNQRPRKNDTSMFLQKGNLSFMPATGCISIGHQICLSETCEEAINEARLTITLESLTSSAATRTQRLWKNNGFFYAVWIDRIIVENLVVVNLNQVPKTERLI